MPQSYQCQEREREREREGERGEEVREEREQSTCVWCGCVMWVTCEERGAKREGRREVKSSHHAAVWVLYCCRIGCCVGVLNYAHSQRYMASFVALLYFLLPPLSSPPRLRPSPRPLRPLRPLRPPRPLRSPRSPRLQLEHRMPSRSGRHLPHRGQ